LLRQQRQKEDHGKTWSGCDHQQRGEISQFCQQNDLVIGGTLFAHKEIHKLTWTSPDSRTQNQIDHIIITYTRSIYRIKYIMRRRDCQEKYCASPRLLRKISWVAATVKKNIKYRFVFLVSPLMKEVQDYIWHYQDSVCFSICSLLSWVLNPQGRQV